VCALLGQQKAKAFLSPAALEPAETAEEDKIYFLNGVKVSFSLRSLWPLREKKFVFGFQIPFARWEK